MAEGTSFWGIKAYNNVLVRWVEKGQMGWTVEGSGVLQENFVRLLTHIEE